MYCLAMNFSRSRDRMGVIDMGRNSLGDEGCLVFGIGWMMLDFHCGGKNELLMQLLKMIESGVLIAGAIN